MSVLLDALRRMQAQPAKTPASPSDTGNGAADAVAKAREAAQSLLTARPQTAFRTGRQRIWLMAAGAAALLLPMGGWMAWEAFHPPTPVTLPASMPVSESLAQNQPDVHFPQAQNAIVLETIVSDDIKAVDPLPVPAIEKAVAPTSTQSISHPPPPVPVKAVKTEPAATEPQPLSRPAPAQAVGARKAPALATAPASPAPLVVRSEANRQLQEAWTALGQYDAARALRLYRQVLTERPDDPDANLGVAVALHQQKNLTEAWDAYQHSLRLWPENPTARTGLLAILSESDAVAAESRLNEWVQSHPRDAAAQAALGKLLGRQSRWAEALLWLNRAHSLEPARATYAYNLAVALDQSRRYAEAARYYQLALKLGGAGVPVSQVQHRLQELADLGEP